MKLENNDNLISTFGSKSSKRRHKINEATKNILSDKQTDREILVESLSLDREIMADKNAMQIKESINYKNKSHSRVRDNSLKEALKLEIENNVNRRLFAHIVKEALVLDSEFKNNKKHSDYIIESANQYFDFIVSNNIIDVKENSLFEDMIISVHTIVESKGNNSIIEDEVFNEALKDNEFELEFVIPVIKSKLVEAINMEGKIAEERDKLINEDKYVDDQVTLFRVLMNKNIDNVIKESNENHDKENIKNAALAESMIDYTILETAHTLQLINIDYSKLKKSNLSV